VNRPNSLSSTSHTAREPKARERQAFNDIADHFGVEKRLDISIEHLAKIGGSSLTDEKIPVTEADLDSKDIPTSYVPFRNANMLSIAVSWAEVIGAGAIYIGAVAEDSSGYPDCRPEFFEAFQKTIDAGTKPDTRIEIRTPIIHLSKAEIVKKGIELDAPLHLTWSCYRSEDSRMRNVRFMRASITRIRARRTEQIRSRMPSSAKPNEEASFSGRVLDHVCGHRFRTNQIHFGLHQPLQSVSDHPRRKWYR
jgi:7-cyano-7-deazaguanine synthase